MTYKNKNLFISKFLIKNYKQISKVQKINAEAGILGVKKNSHKLTSILLNTIFKSKPKLNLIETRTSYVWIAGIQKYKNCLELLKWMHKNLKITDSLLNPFKLKKKYA